MLQENILILQLLLNRSIAIPSTTSVNHGNTRKKDLSTWGLFVNLMQG